MKGIIIDKRPDDYTASIKGKPGNWESGQDETEAVGKLIQSHPEFFGIEIEHKVWK